jgi:hypothetical protein
MEELTRDTLESIFDLARKSYPGSKRGCGVEFENFRHHHKNWKDIIPILCSKIDYQKKVYSWLRNTNRFVPPWQNFQTWLNQSSWEREFPDYDSAQNAIKRTTTPQDSKSPETRANVAPAIEIATPEQRRKIAAEHDWRI